MKNQKGFAPIIILFLAVLILVAFFIIKNVQLKSLTTSLKTPNAVAQVLSGSPSSSASFVSVSGANLTYQGQVLNLRGVNFNNEPAAGGAGEGNPAGNAGSNNLADVNVAEADYAQASSLGANLIRWGMGSNQYYANKQQFFQILDQHVAWAKAHNLWMIPVNFTTPDNCYEGYTFSCHIFWNDTSSGGLQDQLVNFWVDVATHYKNETAIAGYDILNEPTPGKCNPDPWTKVAQRIRDAITAVDPNHFIVFEASSCGFSKLNGSNIVYSSHSYLPLSMTYNTTLGKYSYPGNAPDNGVMKSWSKNAFEGLTGDRTTDLRNRTGYSTIHSIPAPLFIGEDGSKKFTTNYAQLVGDKFSIYNNLGISWAFFVWREGPKGFGVYPYKGFSLTPIDQTLLNAVSAQWSGAIKPISASSQTVAPSTSASASAN